MLTEPLLKLVSNSTYRALNRNLLHMVLMQDQYAMAPGGAQSVVIQAQAEMTARANSDDIALSTDVQNAFGKLKRSAIIKAMDVHCPQVIKWLATSWEVLEAMDAKCIRDAVEAPRCLEL